MSSKLRVVIADDNGIFLDTLVQALSLDKDIEVVGSCTVAEEAVKIIEQEPVDVLLADLGWRQDPVAGIKIIHEAKAVSPGLRVVVCSQHDDAGIVRQAIWAGAKGYLLKDEIEIVDVVQAVKTVGNDRSFFSPDILETVTRLLSETERPGAPQQVGVVHPLESLTRREREIVPLLMEGLTNEQIADRLGIGRKTVKVHVSNILQKLNLRSRHQVGSLVGKPGD